VVETAEREIDNIRQLLRNPTPTNLEAANRKLESLALFLGSLPATLISGQNCDSKLREFITRLPGAMARIRILIENQADFYRGLSLSRALKFGSYDESGNPKRFEIQAAAKTVVHL
jgi:hypothetical protein